MKSILSILLAAFMLIGVMSGCAKDMSGETRTTPTPGAATANPTATTRPTAGATQSAAPDSTADGIIDAGKDAVDGVVGAGEDVVNDVVGAGEDIIDDVTGNNHGAGQNGAQSTAKPESTPKSTANH